jgi:hypothetical protein
MPERNDEPVLPWMVALQDGKVHSGNVMYLTDAQGQAPHLHGELLAHPRRLRAPPACS